MHRVGFEPTKHYASDLKSDPFDRSGILTRKNKNTLTLMLCILTTLVQLTSSSILFQKITLSKQFTSAPSFEAGQILNIILIIRIVCCMHFIILKMLILILLIQYAVNILSNSKCLSIISVSFFIKPILIFFFSVWKLFMKLFSLALYHNSKDNSLMLTVGLEPTTSAL